MQKYNDLSAHLYTQKLSLQLCTIHKVNTDIYLIHNTKGYNDMKSYYTQQEKLRAVRAHCKAQGATFKKSNSYINNKQAWHIESRSTGQALVQNLTIDSAFDAIENNALNW